jgi:hypothetical protein
MNGTLGRVVALAADGVSLQVGSGEDVRLVHLDPAAYPGLRHGFATTVHKSQGMSAASVHLHVTPGFDHAMAFVGMTRHTDRLSLYVPRTPEGALSYLERVLARVDAAPAALDHATDPGRALAAAFGTLPEASVEGPGYVTTSARAGLDRFADRHARAGLRRWDRSPASRGNLFESFRRALASTFRPVNEHDWLARKDAALLRRGFRAGLARSGATAPASVDRASSADRVALPESRQAPRLEIRAALAAAWARISATPLDAVTRDRLWRLADDLASPAGWREALRDVPVVERRALLSDADDLADRMVTADPATGERRPDPALRMLARAWALAHATGRREDEAVLTDVLAERTTDIALARGYNHDITREPVTIREPDVNRGEEVEQDDSHIPERSALEARARNAAQRHIERGRARAQDRLLGLVRGPDEDPLSPEAVAQREHALRVEEARRNLSPAVRESLNRLREGIENAVKEGMKPEYTKSRDRGGIEW